ncbi:hypothetical protein CVO77_17175 [Sphingopyxis lindanitolerans]|uniref:Stress response protein n=1 Tax=Sphingopyxis lindanitolerans TaxID=2054227 RepID=A0A2S8B2V8_9SPHN|nr:hypothetical protein [Sphingopyxis lindanitolerans]PQM26734.1 hypothetical protein CVO77_17175 [Sphingopyxis lindanitolerans]
MSDIPDFLTAGEAARLFPVLSENSKEGRTLSIFLACLENVGEFGRVLLGGLGAKAGARAKIDTFTEVVLKKTSPDKSERPDGLIMLRNGGKVWTALVEAKVGTNDLTNAQIEGYLALARINGIDAVITLSNQFTALPTHHPLTINSSLTKKVGLFHWSWGYVITQAQLLREQGAVADREQQILLAELQRFLLHGSSGVKEYDQMPAAWSEICAQVAAGAGVPAKHPLAQDVVGGWHQALDRMIATLSRQIGKQVKLTLSGDEASDPAKRLKGALASLSAGNCLKTEIAIPGAAARIQIAADLPKRTLAFGMRLKAPADKKSTKARLSWLLRQLASAEPTDLYVRLGWPGSSPSTQYPLSALRADLDIASQDRPGMAPHAFDVLLVRDLGGKFSQRKNFVSELLQVASQYHANVGEHLIAWQAKPPKISEDRRTPGSVSTEAMRDEIEQEALQRSGA